MGKWTQLYVIVQIYMKFKNKDSYNFKIIKLEIRMYFSSSTQNMQGPSSIPSNTQTHTQTCRHTDIHKHTHTHREISEII